MDRSALTAISNQVSAATAAHEAAMAQMKAANDALVAELNRDPSLDDVQAELAEVAARMKKPA